MNRKEMYGLHEQLLAGLFRHLDEVGYRKVAQVHQNSVKIKVQESLLELI